MSALRPLFLGAVLMFAVPVQAVSTPILGPDASACAPNSGKSAVLVTVKGFKNRQGTLRLELWPGNDEDFMRNHHELVAEGKAYHRVTVPVPASGDARVCVPLPSAGTYALGAFHSPSGVRKFNFRRDGATFTRNPKVGLSKPKAAETAMSFHSGLNESTVTLSYLRGLSFRPLKAEDIDHGNGQ